MITTNKQDYFSTLQNWDFKAEIKEEDCRKDFPDYDTLLKAYMKSQFLINLLLLLLLTFSLFFPIKNQTNRLSSLKLSQYTRAKRDQMSIQIYDTLLEVAKGSTYSKIRLRVALCILFITGISLNTLLCLRVSQLTTIREEGWIAIDKPSLESSLSKAHLTEIGKTILQKREEDFTTLFLNKTADDFVFTSQRKPSNRLARETLTREINKITSSVSNEFVNITSYSFRIGEITLLWKDPKDIVFVRKSLSFPQNQNN